MAPAHQRPEALQRSTTSGLAGSPLPALQKAPSGIPGLDEITEGGLPRGRTSLVCGGAGCGKTLFGMQFLVRGAVDHGEPGVFLAFEESEQDLIENVASLGFDLGALMDAGMLAMDHIRVERSEIDENGEYNLDGLFIRLNLAIESVGAKRVVIDTLETLFGGLDDYAILRSELRRLFHWLKERGVSAIVTAERGDGTLTRHGLEEYVSDCVILLDHRVVDQVSTRRLRVVKYRGSTHGTNEYPFLIDADGITVMPITSAGLDHPVSDERISSGIPALDDMLGGGYYRGSTVLVSGTAGAGKSTLAAHFADACCRRGERCLYLSFEESPSQIKRNMASIGQDLAGHEEAGLLRFVAARPTAHGLEMHLALVYKLVREFEPDAVVADPIGTLIGGGERDQAHHMAVRLIDYLKAHRVTGLLTNLTHGSESESSTRIQISSICDTWLLVRSVEVSGERNRTMYVLKSRGMAHSNQVREFLITHHGVELVDVYVGEHGVLLTGSARVQQEHRDRDTRVLHEQELERRYQELERKRALIERQVETLQAEFLVEEATMQRAIAEQRAAVERVAADRSALRTRRSAAKLRESLSEGVMAKGKT